jgi:prepilin-type processing-associated H-X9-DG protein
VLWTNGWSVHGRILPYLEQGAMFSATNFSLHYETPQNLTVTGQMVAVFLCPSEVRQEPKVEEEDGIALRFGITNYGFNRGDWYVWGGFNGLDNRGAFTVNRSRRIAEFSDGLSQSILAAEVKTYQPHYRCGQSLSNVNNPQGSYSPYANPLALVPEYGGSCGDLETEGHTEWADGNAFESGFTTAWGPNQKIQAPNSTADLDIVSKPEAHDPSPGGPTFAAINARSYHPGGVNALFGDGSVKFVKDTINGGAWRALGSLRGGEVISGDAY